MRLNRYKETRLVSWGWRTLCGPAAIVDGLVQTATLSIVNPGLVLAVTRRLAMSRIGSTK